MSIGDYDNKRYCGSVALQSASPARTQGAYAQFSIPLSQFSCPFAVSSASQARSIPLSVADSAILSEPETRTLFFCVFLCTGCADMRVGRDTRQRAQCSKAACQRNTGVCWHGLWHDCDLYSER